MYIRKYIPSECYIPLGLRGNKIKEIVALNMSLLKKNVSNVKDITLYIFLKL